MKAKHLPAVNLAEDVGVARSVVMRILSKDGKYGPPSAVVIGKPEKTLDVSMWPFPLPPTKQGSTTRAGRLNGYRLM